jgi:DNA-binding beta-propeller fold protein YncE
MSTLRFASVVAVVLFAASCKQSKVVPKSSGSVAVSRDDALLFVADAYHDRLTVIDTASKTVLRQTALAMGPERGPVAPSGAVSVTSRGARTVSRLTADGAAVLATATACTSPTSAPAPFACWTSRPARSPR